MNQKGFVKFAIIMLIVLFGIVWTFFALNREIMKPPKTVFCTQEVKECADGSFIHRIGPKCEFTKCPETNPTPTTNGEKITKKVGEREGSFLIQKINSASVDGLWYQAYPVARAEGTPKTLHIGDDIGYACEGVSEKLTAINFSGQTVTFTKITKKPPYGGCPI